MCYTVGLSAGLGREKPLSHMVIYIDGPPLYQIVKHGRWVILKGGDPKIRGLGVMIDVYGSFVKKIPQKSRGRRGVEGDPKNLGGDPPSPLSGNVCQ
jgi:hypothetical protein